MTKRIMMALFIFLMNVVPINMGWNVEAQTKKDPEIALANALDYIAKLDLERAYDWLNILIKDFPNSIEAKQSKVLKVLINTSEVLTYGMLMEDYAEGMQKAFLDENKSELAEMVNKTSSKICSYGERLMEDLKVLFPIVGEDIKLQISRDYDLVDLNGNEEIDLVRKILKMGYPPSLGEQEKIVEYRRANSICVAFVQMIAGSNEEVSKKKREEFAYETKTLSGEVDWAGCLACAGDSLIGPVVWWKVGVNKDPQKAKQSHLLVKECFEKVVHLLKDQPYNKLYRHAQTRIDEMNEIFKEIDE